MFKKIVSTFSTRLLISVFSFLIIILSTKFLGAEGRGEISILLLGITIITMISNIFGGTALIYLLPRFDFIKLFVPAVIWSVICSAVFSFVLKIFGLIPTDFAADIFVLSLLASLTSANISLLTGREKINEQNLINLIQIVLLIFVLSVEIYSGHRTVQSYVNALYISYGITFILSIYFLRSELKFSSLKNILPVLRQILKYGFYVQFAMLVQTLNYRFSFYILDHEAGKSAVGIFSVAVAMADACWLVARSIALVQYARIANTANQDYARLLSLRLAKFSFSATTLIVLLLILLPASFYQFVFGNSFGEVRYLMLITSPGIAFFGFTMMASHYFAGIGKHYFNTLTSFAGFVVTVVLSYLLIPRYHLTGAAITSCCSYLVTGGFLLYIFKKHSNFKVRELIPSIGDFIFFRNQLQKLSGKHR
jgi:O-antigen/teichoic acid export membrane protein